MSSIGQRGPGSPLKEKWPAPLVVLEAMSRFVSAQTIRTVLTQTGTPSPAFGVIYVYWVHEDSNLGPRSYQRRALAN